MNKYFYLCVSRHSRLADDICSRGCRRFEENLI